MRLPKDVRVEREPQQRDGELGERVMVSWTDAGQLMGGWFFQRKYKKEALRRISLFRWEQYEVEDYDKMFRLEQEKISELLDVGHVAELTDIFRIDRWEREFVQ